MPGYRCRPRLAWGPAGHLLAFGDGGLGRDGGDSVARQVIHPLAKSNVSRSCGA
jgi:hypothetical protein